jgi:hypothetical protein
MTSLHWDDDERLLEELRDALREAPQVPERVLSAARGAFAWRTVDEDLELASLVYDSFVDEGMLVRGAPGEAPRTLAFSTGELSVEIEVTREGIIGQLVPPGRGDVVLVTRDGPVASAVADEVGCFALPRSGGEPVRLRCSCEAGRLETAWLQL